MRIFIGKHFFSLLFDRCQNKSFKNYWKHIKFWVQYWNIIGVFTDVSNIWFFIKKIDSCHLVLLNANFFRVFQPILIILSPIFTEFHVIFQNRYCMKWLVKVGNMFIFLTLTEAKNCFTKCINIMEIKYILIIFNPFKHGWFSHFFEK